MRSDSRVWVRRHAEPRRYAPTSPHSRSPCDSSCRQQSRCQPGMSWSAPAAGDGGCGGWADGGVISVRWMDGPVMSNWLTFGGSALCGTTPTTVRRRRQVTAAGPHGRRSTRVNRFELIEKPAATSTSL